MRKLRIDVDALKVERPAPSFIPALRFIPRPATSACLCAMQNS